MSILPALIVLVNDPTPPDHPVYSNPGFRTTGNAWWVPSVDEGLHIVRTLTEKAYAPAAIALHDGRSYTRIVWNNVHHNETVVWTHISPEAKWIGHEKLIQMLNYRRKKRAHYLG